MLNLSADSYVNIKLHIVGETAGYQSVSMLKIKLWNFFFSSLMRNAFSYNTVQALIGSLSGGGGLQGGLLRIQGAEGGALSVLGEDWLCVWEVNEKETVHCPQI